MSLPRKRPSHILKRDREFTQTIGKPASDRPNPFDMVGKELREKLEAARPTEVSEAPPADPAPVNPTIRSEKAAAHDLSATRKSPRQRPRQSEEAGHTHDRPHGKTPQLAQAEHGLETAPATEAPDSDKVAASVTVEPLAEGAGGTDAYVDVVLTIRIHADIAKRAETWAAAVGLPPTTLLRNSLNRFKPELLREFKTIKAGDVHMDRPESVGRQHMQTRVQLTPAEIADMEARLDPAGFGVLRSMLNHYTRARFSSYLDEMMANAGY